MKNNCIECGSSFRGRTDKKFCNDSCRSTYNNRRYRTDLSMVRKVNITLRRNRQILEQLWDNGRTEVEKALLLGRGFDFNYFTGTCTDPYGKEYYLVYDLGYYAPSTGKVTLNQLTLASA